MTPDLAAQIAQSLRANDPDRYWASLVLPAEKRAAVQSLYAFSADIAAVRARVSQPTPGEIRLQWWDDALGGTQHGAVGQNPLAATLQDTLRRYGLSEVPLRRLIAARRFDLYDDPMPDLTSFEGYAGETVSALYQYAAMILNAGAAVEPGDAAGHLGVATAGIGHLRAFGYNAGHGQLFVPLHLLRAHGVNETDIFAGRQTGALQAALQAFAEIAEQHLQKAEAAIEALPRQLRPAFAATTLLRPQLAAWRRQQNLFAGPTDLADWSKIGRLWWWTLRQG